jgi:hypothetical protein
LRSKGFRVVEASVSFIETGNLWLEQSLIDELH